MSNNYFAALTVYLEPEIYSVLRGNGPHAEVEETLQLICKSGPVSVVLVNKPKDQTT